MTSLPHFFLQKKILFRQGNLVLEQVSRYIILKSSVGKGIYFRNFYNSVFSERKRKGKQQNDKKIEQEEKLLYFKASENYTKPNGNHNSSISLAAQTWVIGLAKHQEEQGPSCGMFRRIKRLFRRFQHTSEEKSMKFIYRLFLTRRIKVSKTHTMQRQFFSFGREAKAIRQSC